jgi:uncharacterized protein (TIGR02646 family)
MMPVKRPKATAALSRPTQQDLKKRQTTANAYNPGDKPIGNAWKRFSGTPARTEVESKLDEVFHTKCAYCENIVPRDIEHFYPKSKFPKRMFRWDNFLRACKNCNTDKLAIFPLHADGSPLLLDPCNDEPSDFFTWDLATGMPVLNADPSRRSRADATIVMFDLRNQQVCEERRSRAQKFQFVLLQSIEKTPTPPDVHKWLLDELKVTRPWRSVLRQILRDPTSQRLVERVKQAVPAAARLLTELAA